MGYNWGTFLFIMGYLIEVHNISAEIEGFLGKNFASKTFYGKKNVVVDFF